ncbi:MAG: aminotransferase class I/II-fold pyridoxal phosphate-dependent enzyme [Thalassotalea sp.]|nr:aminotransferase class I/II-fold pyridoxal phosphate-dependent enzyme [Thalassotalea sp.]
MKIVTPPHIAYTQQFTGKINCNLSNSCAQSLAVEQLLTLPNAEQRWTDFLQRPLSYTSVKGDGQLRSQIAEFVQHQNKFSTQSTLLNADDVITFTGAQEALRAIYKAVLEPNDEVIVFTPNYPSLTAMVGEFGAQLVPIALRHEDGWRLDIERLAEKVSEKTKLIVVNVPHNPTGAILSTKERQQVLEIAKSADCYLLADDVSQPISFSITDTDSQDCFYGDRSLAHDYLNYDVEYEKTVSVGVMSKAFGLGGVRLGWVVSRHRELLDALLAIKAGASICTSATDECFAQIAFDNADNIIINNRKLVETNVLQGKQIIDRSTVLDWQQPRAGLLALVSVNTDVSIEEWAPDFTNKTGVLILPAFLFGLEGNYFRLGLGQSDMREGLLQLVEYVQTL